MILLLEHFFDLADLLLNYAGGLLIPPFVYEFTVIRNLAHRLLHFAFDFMKLALYLICRAGFH